MLALPGLLVLLGGLPALLRTGQVDPRGWMVPALLSIPMAAVLKGRLGDGAAWWAGLGTVGAVLSCAFLAAWRVPALLPVLWLLAVVLAAMFAGLMFRIPTKALERDEWLATARSKWRDWVRAFAGAGRIAAMGLALLALAACWLAQEPAVQRAPHPPKLSIITGLPLFWRDGAQVDAPIVTVLRQRFDLSPLDSPLALENSPAKTLLLVQPRAFSMDELVALNGWISRGGKALVLADPELRWPMDLPLGDRRRPPAVTLLAAMIEYWGVRLTPPSAGEKRHFLGDGRVLTVYSASGFEDAGPKCRIVGRGLVARCMVGKGSATIVADADLIDDRLWLADAAASLEPGQWTADTPQFVAEALGATLPAGRRWVRSGDALVNAVRWAVLVGIFWAALGTVFFRRRGAAPLDLSSPRPARPTPFKEG
ncbi:MULTISPECIES: Gldg family protein [Sphingobium]|uniref:ABC-type uncharacterized transport system domain-containing protein n=1 Tax=Sphingobium fuliginis (strain ATCC 27551) TaxID=336203 RepID=A0ABQ1EN89_SPHSA|nr:MULTISPECIES: hypothetical protein [Sphingobium]UXC89571.1 hypothetical protein EGM87_10825 [Sphingobium sp. RSMS]WDA38492.1 hypothetical protein PO876_10065 [Sphingobium sp. YC-XJ3]GFZ79344.1 hypothetical protein GCM10019071_05010 [Sphingobium fuliginis]